MQVTCQPTAGILLAESICYAGSIPSNWHISCKLQCSCQSVDYQGGAGGILHVIDLYAKHHSQLYLQVNNLLEQIAVNLITSILVIFAKLIIDI